MKTYGKEPESLESIVSLFNEALGDFTPEKINAAFKIHAQHSQEFPTPADIVGLIRRNGRPPMKESEIIAIRKKDGENRTRSEWAMLREWDAEQQDGWSEFDDQKKDQATLQENLRLRQQIIDLKSEVQRLADLVQITGQAKLPTKPQPSMQEKIANTVAVMRAGGASEADIEAFTSQYAA